MYAARDDFAYPRDQLRSSLIPLQCRTGNAGSSGRENVVTSETLVARGSVYSIQVLNFNTPLPPFAYG